MGSQYRALRNTTGSKVYVRDRVIDSKYGSSTRNIDNHPSHEPVWNLIHWYMMVRTIESFAKINEDKVNQNLTLERSYLPRRLLKQIFNKQLNGGSSLHFHSNSFLFSQASTHSRLSQLSDLCFTSPNQLLPLTAGDDDTCRQSSHTTWRWKSLLHRTTNRLFGLNLPVGQRSSRQYCALLTVCVSILHLSYLIWGVMQERIMTRQYGGNGLSKPVMFTDPQYLVFANRLVTALLLTFLHHVVHLDCNPCGRLPLASFALASLSNITSSWCQYEALRFISFPTQIIVKSFKVVPVMLMGICLRTRTYSFTDYLFAVSVASGVCLFGLSSPPPTPNSHLHDDNTTALVGLLLLLAYIGLDSFTSNWQDRLFKRYSLSTLQVASGVTGWSISLTLIPLLLSGRLFKAVAFTLSHPWTFGLDTLTSALCSAVGQLAIFATIANFGPAVFALVATARLALSIALSCYIFSHRLTPLGWLGVGLTFGSLLPRAAWRSGRR